MGKHIDEIRSCVNVNDQISSEKCTLEKVEDKKNASSSDEEVVFEQHSKEIYPAKSCSHYDERHDEKNETCEVSLISSTGAKTKSTSSIAIQGCNHEDTFLNDHLRSKNVNETFPTSNECEVVKSNGIPSLLSQEHDEEYQSDLLFEEEISNQQCCDIIDYVNPTCDECTLDASLYDETKELADLGNALEDVSLLAMSDRVCDKFKFERLTTSSCNEETIDGFQFDREYAYVYPQEDESDKLNEDIQLNVEIQHDVDCCHDSPAVRKNEQIENLLSMMDCDHSFDKVISNSISYDWGNPIYDQTIEFSDFEDDDTLICHDFHFDIASNSSEDRKEEMVEIMDQSNALLSCEQI